MSSTSSIGSKALPRIVIVDDSKAFLSGITKLISDKYDITTFISPLEAIEVITQNPPDVIVCDLLMPELHGFDFIRQIRENPKMMTVPILVITNNNDTESMSKSISIGADAFCAKETIRYTIEPHLQALLRLKETYKTEISKKQLETTQILIGSYKHELGNSLAIISGMLRKYKKEFPEAKEHICMLNIESSINRIEQTLENLQRLRHIKDEDSSEFERILKIG